MVLAIEESIAYFEKTIKSAAEDGQPANSQHAQMKDRLESLLHQIQGEAQGVSGLVLLTGLNQCHLAHDNELAAIDRELAALWEGDGWKQLPPYNLASVAYHDGLSNKGNVHAYFKARNGKWYKTMGNELSEVRLLLHA